MIKRLRAWWKYRDYSDGYFIVSSGRGFHVVRSDWSEVAFFPYGGKAPDVWRLADKLESR